MSTDLRHGVRTALASIEQTLRGRPAEPSHREQALTLIYRILFLLYAEARSLVPLWHPVYRESYSVEALRESIERGETPTGYWEALQAISRMARQGCQWQSLRVTPFNGRLFAPGATPLGERPSLDDGTVRQVLVALTTRPVRGGGRRRVAYGDLGVDGEPIAQEQGPAVDPDKESPLIRRHARADLEDHDEVQDRRDHNR